MNKKENSTNWAKNHSEDTTMMMNFDTTISSNAPSILTLISEKPKQWIGKVWSLEDNHTLGRSKEKSTIYIPEHSLSRTHVQFILEENIVKIKDLHSTNGTFLNNKKLNPDKIYTLKNNDLLKLGSLIFKFISGKNIEAQSALKIREQIYTDSLCQIYNRKFIEEKGNELFLRCAGQNRPLSLILMDIDHFKKINDQYTHLGGDFILFSLASIIQKWIRQLDYLCRMGGEEFAILTESSLDSAALLAEKIQENISKETFEFEGYYIRTTLSIGVTEIKKEDTEWKDIYKRADKALYLSKNQGRNKVSIA